MESLVRTFLANYVVPSPEMVTDVAQRLRRVAMPRETRLLTAGEVCRHLYLVEKGFARGFYHDAADRERTSWFWSEQDVLVSYESFLQQTPTEENIELLEDAVLYRLGFDDLQELYDRHPALNRVGRLLAEEAFFRAGNLARILRLGNTRENYLALVEAYPQLLQRAYLKDIAGYLGVSQETISRVRAAVANAR